MIQETNNRKINNYLFKKIFKDLNEFKFLPQNHFFNKTWYKNNSFADLRTLKKKIFNKIYDEIISKKKNRIVNKKNEKIQCEYYYGRTLTKQFLAPLLKKYTGEELRNLPSNFRNIFNLSRFLIADEKDTKILKKNFFLDKTIGFNNFKEGLSGKKNFYPFKGGIENFINMFLDESVRKK